MNGADCNKTSMWINAMNRVLTLKSRNSLPFSMVSAMSIKLFPIQRQR